MNGTMNTERIERTGRGEYRRTRTVETWRSEERLKARQGARRKAAQGRQAMLARRAEEALED